MTQWQPIDSAPRRALIVAADHGRSYWAVGCINAYGEFEETERDGSLRGIGFYPTHWMPLPDPPSAEPEPSAQAAETDDPNSRDESQ